MVLMYSVLKLMLSQFKKDFETAQSCLRFHNDIGGWRCSKEENMHLPTDAYK